MEVVQLASYHHREKLQDPVANQADPNQPADGHKAVPVHPLPFEVQLSAVGEFDFDFQKNSSFALAASRRNVV